MVQVPDWSKDEFENRSSSLARLIRLAWRAIARAFAGRLESQVVATSADVAGLPAAWDMEVEAQILGYVTDTYLDAASKMRTELDAPSDFIPTDDLVAAYLRTARNRLRNIGDDVWEIVSDQLIQGISAGESIPELAARVRNTAGVSDVRSLTIARTEVHAAHEAGSYDQALFVDPTATKVWLATEDARTRPTHQAAEGQRRAINEAFDIGGAALRYPGDPLGPADEVINCRCTTVYDFGTLDSVTSDDPELALVAASKKKWTPSKHPRGSDGKFIKKGAISDFLAKPKPTLQGVAHAIDSLDEKSWGQLTDAQQDYIRDSYGKLPKGSTLEKNAAEKLIKLGAIEAPKDEPAQAPESKTAAPAAAPKAKVLAQAAPKSNKAAQTILETDDFAQLGNQKYKKPLGKTGKPLRVGFLGDDGSITAHVGLKPGEPTKSSTFLIWGKYPPGTTILESADSTKSVVWNGKKYEFREDGQPTQVLGKQAAYDKLHSQEGWVVPKYEGQPVDQPGVLTELVEGYEEPDDEVDTDLPDEAPAPEPTPATEPEAEPEPAAPEVAQVPEVAPAPEPEPEVAQATEPEAGTLQQLMDEIAADDPIQMALLDLKLTGQVTQQDAVKLAIGMTQAEWNGLTADQRSKIALGSDLALDNESIDSQDAWLAFNKVSEFQANQTAPAPTPSSATKINVPEPVSAPEPEPVAVSEPEAPSPTPGTITDEGEWVAIAANEFWPVGAVVAETTDGEFKLTKGFAPNTWYLKDYNNETITSYTDADVEAGQAQAENPFHEWKAASMPEPPESVVDAPVADEFDAEDNEIGGESDWEMLLDDVGTVTAPTIIATSAGGGYRLVKDPSGELSIEWNVDDKWIDVETFTGDSLADNGQTYSEVMGSHAATWIKTDPQALETPAPAPQTALPGVNSGSLSPQEIGSLLAQPHPAGTVIAINDDGDLRLLANGDGTFSTEFVSTSGTWEPLSKNYSPTDIQESLATGKWTVDGELAANIPSAPAPVNVFETPALDLPNSTQFTLSAGKLSSELDAYTDYTHPAGTIIGVTPDGTQRLISSPESAYVLQLKTGDDSWFDAATVPPSSAAAMLHQNPWLIPDQVFATTVPSANPPLGAPVIELPNDTIYTPVVGLTSKEMNQYINFDHPAGSIVAYGNINGTFERVVATGLPSPKFKLQQKAALSDSWEDAPSPELIGADVKDAFLNDSWLIPMPTLKTVQTANVSAPAAPMVDLGGDTSSIPLSAKKAWKKKLSAAKIGYYSKPEKIWDQIKEIQDQYPDPMNPGQSKLTPLQVIKSLDEVYTGKTLTAPYETKMVPWASTPKGMAYTGNKGGSQVSTPNAPNATQTAPPPTPQKMEATPENLDKLWESIEGLDVGTVLATNAGGDQQYQMVIADVAGQKLPQVQYKKPTELGWKVSVALPHKSGFLSVMNTEFDNQPWKLAVVQLPNGGVPSATTPAPSVSTPTMQPVSNTMTNASNVWSKIGGLPEDTVLATNPGGLNQYRMVVKTDPNGTPYIQIQRQVKSDPNGPWIDAVDVVDAVQFHDSLNDSLGGNSWQLFNPQVSTPDAPVAPPTPPAPAGPPPPKPFKTSVKGIYAVMPTLKTGQFVATAEVDGVKYGLVVGYGHTKSWKPSSKKKLILKKQMPSGAWATVEQMDTQVKLGAVLKDPKYAWIETADVPAVPPPSVTAPVTAPSPKSASATAASMTYSATNAGIEDLWNHLDEMGDGVTIATTKIYGDQVTLKSSIKGGKNSIISISNTGTQTVAESADDLKALLVGGSWDIKATKSPLFGAGDIADLSEGKKQDLYTKFKGQPSTYLDSPTASIYGALSYIAGDNGVTLLQMIRVVDDIGAKKVNKPDEHLFEKKIKDWLKTPQGAAVAMGKPIPMPDQPDLLPSVDPKKIMSLAESDKLSYKTVSVDKAKKLNDEFKAASPAGKWNAAQEHGLAIYTGGTYIPINNFYRGKTTDITSANQQAALEAQQAMRPSTVPLLLHRGVGYDGIGGSNSHADIEKKVGQTWQGGGFFSTSVGGKAAFGGPVLIELEAPPGTPMAFVDSPSDVDSYKKCVSVNCGEREMLLAAGLYYKVISVKYEGGKSVVRLRVVPTPDEEEE